MPINFFIQSGKNPAPVYVRFREGRGTDAKARTQYTVNPNDWSAAKGKAKESDLSTKALNSELEAFRRRLSDRLNKRKPSEKITTEWLKEFIRPTKSAGNTLLGCFDHLIEEKRDEFKHGKYSDGALKKLVVNRNLLSRMQEELPSLTLVEDVNMDFIREYKAYCQKHKYAPVTIERAVGHVVTVCRYARRRGIPTHPELDQIKEKTVKVKHIYLTFEELDKIEAKQLPDYLDNARDWLIISCYTGQRISDFLRFTKDMLKEEKGKLLLEFTQVKTKKIMTIPVHEKVKGVLSKRNGDFPRAISDQKYNDYVKEVCREAGLTEKIQGSKKDKETNRKQSGTFEKWELVSSHIGRRSFASNFFGLLPTSSIMFMTGHTTEAQFYAYIGKAERTKAFHIADIWDREKQKTPE